MSAPFKTWDGNNLQNSTQFVRNATNNPSAINFSNRSVPVLPPRPGNSQLISNYGGNSYMPYSGMGYGGYSSYGSYGMPYRSSLYNSYGTYNNNYGMFGNVGYPNFTADDHEQRFIQYAEENSRNTFASVESIVRAVNSMAMMLDNTFFAMTSSFRAILNVAENFGRLRTMFGHIWYSINIFRFFNWLYRKIMQMLGYKVPHNVTSMAWKEATKGVGSPSGDSLTSSSWPTIAFLGVLVSAPYLISKILPKYEDKGDPANWKSPGVRAKAVFDFVSSAPNELSIQANDFILLAPTYIQEEMNLRNSGWAFAVCKGRSGVVPLNYLVINKTKPIGSSPDETPIPRISTNNNINSNNTKTHTKRVSFGENQIFENIDLEDYVKNESNINSHDKKEKDFQSDSIKQNGFSSMTSCVKKGKEVQSDSIKQNSNLTNGLEEGTKNVEETNQ